MFTPVINLPQSAILGVNTIVPRPKDLGDGVYAFVPYRAELDLRPQSVGWRRSYPVFKANSHRNRNNGKPQLLTTNYQLLTTTTTIL